VDCSVIVEDEMVMFLCKGGEKAKDVFTVFLAFSISMWECEGSCCAVWFHTMNQSLADLIDLDVVTSHVEIVKSPISWVTFRSSFVKYCPLNTVLRLTARPDKTDFHSESGNSGAAPELRRCTLASLMLRE